MSAKQGGRRSMSVREKWQCVRRREDSDAVTVQNLGRGSRAQTLDARKFAHSARRWPAARGTDGPRALKHLLMHDEPYPTMQC